MPEPDNSRFLKHLSDTANHASDGAIEPGTARRVDPKTGEFVVWETGENGKLLPLSVLENS